MYLNDNCDHKCENCSEECNERTAENFRAKMNSKSEINKVFGIVSGKGGVGKSLITSLAAVCAKKSGYKTAILDADITGPSIPKMFGLNNKAGLDESGEGILPAVTKTGIKVMSLNLLMEQNTDPVVWRGPVIAGAVKQFWTDVIWGEIDCMFIDMPPGTGDVPLTVFQSLPVDGIIVVASPQELVSMIVAKAVKMAKIMNIPIIGIVENMSYLVCPGCGENIKLFGESHIEEIASENTLEVIAKIPVDPAVATACDAGRIEDYECACLDTLCEKINIAIKKPKTAAK